MNTKQQAEMRGFKKPLISVLRKIALFPRLVIKIQSNQRNYKMLNCKIQKVNIFKSNNNFKRNIYSTSMKVVTLIFLAFVFLPNESKALDFSEEKKLINRKIIRPLTREIEDLKDKISEAIIHPVHNHVSCSKLTPTKNKWKVLIMKAKKAIVRFGEDLKDEIDDLVDGLS